jgi:PAS domain S-box-containing protein
MQSREFLRAILDTVAQPVWVVDHEGLIRFANPAAVAALGYDDASELEGRPSHQTIHYKHPDGSAFPVEECPMLRPRLHGVTIHSEEDWFVRRDGSMFPVEYWSGPIEMPGGRGAVVAFTDIEDRLRTAELDALRRVATLVARGASPADVFATVAKEVANSLDVPLISIVRLEPDDAATHVGVWGAENPFPVGQRWTLDAHGCAGLVARSGRSARVEYENVPGEIAATLVREAGIRAAVGVPVVVDGRVWGVMMALSTDAAPQPADAEERLAGFTELVATAIANTQARDELRLLADEQAALRRAATLVARRAKPAVLFDAVCEETGRLLDATTVNLAHFTPDGLNHTIAGWSLRGVHVPAGTRLPLGEHTINGLVHRTGAPGRFDSYEDAPGPLAARLRALGIRSEVGAPVVVDGEVWGALIAGTDEPDPLPPGTELRLASFAELIGTAVSNATARAALIASRARSVVAADSARRQLARDLHDGAQQELVNVVINLQLAQQTWSDDPSYARELVDRAGDQAQHGVDSLRELVAGIHPEILTSRGLAAAIESLTERLPLPVNTDDLTDGRVAEEIEAGIYFFVAEALTNVVKHARARSARVRLHANASELTVEIGDDGVGGARVDVGGTGLTGLVDRIGALDGKLRIDSRPGHGTTLHAVVPLAGTSHSSAPADPSK